MPKIILPNRPIQLHRFLRDAVSPRSFQFRLLRLPHLLLVEDLAYGRHARLAGDDDDEGCGFAVDGGEDGLCGARVRQFPVGVDEGYGIRFYLVVAGESGFLRPVEGDMSLLRFGSEGIVLRARA